MITRIGFSPDEIKRFFAHPIWQLSRELIQETIEFGRDDMEEAKTMEDFRYAKGKLDAFRSLLTWPQPLLEEKEQQMQEEQTDA